MDKTERLINLTAYLLDTQRPITFEELAETVYSDQPRETKSESSALHKMFERDKEELRDMGIEITVERAELGGEEGYNILHDSYYLPQLDLDPDEKVSITMVSRLFLGSGTPFSGPARSALLKFVFDGDTVEQAPQVHWVSASAEHGGLGAVLEGLKRRKTLEFSYRALDAAEPREREVEPYGLFSRRGFWYLVGKCSYRQDVRCFKLDRITSDVRVNPARPRSPDFEIPAGFDLEREVPWEWPPADGGLDFRARVEFSPRLSFLRESGPVCPVSEKVNSVGGIEVEYEVADPEQFVEWILGLGADARIMSPEELRTMARDRLLGVLKAMES